MKSLLLICFTLLSFSLLAQTATEQALDVAEQELYRLQNEKTELAKSLNAEGKVPKLQKEYLEIEQEYKIQLQKTKELRKAYKKEQRAKKKNQNATVPMYTPSQQPRPVAQPTQSKPTIKPSADVKKAKKAREKQLKNQIKELKKQRKVLIKQAQAAGQNPMTLQSVQDYDRRILDKEAELLQVQTTPLPSPPNAQIYESTPSAQPQKKKQQQPVQVTPQVKEKATTAVNTPQETNIPNVTQQIEIPAIGLSTILFPKFSTEVPRDYGLYLNHVAKQLKDNPGLLLQIDAFTDNSEKNRVSMQLTAGMANSVAQEMVNRGIPPNRLKVEANGSKNAVGDNKNFFGQARNRRVELQFLTP